MRGYGVRKGVVCGCMSCVGFRGRSFINRPRNKAESNARKSQKTRTRQKAKKQIENDTNQLDM